MKKSFEEPRVSIVIIRDNIMYDNEWLMKSGIWEGSQGVEVDPDFDD